MRVTKSRKKQDHAKQQPWGGSRHLEAEEQAHLPWAWPRVGPGVHRGAHLLSSLPFTNHGKPPPEEHKHPRPRHCQKRLGPELSAEPPLPAAQATLVPVPRSEQTETGAGEALGSVLQEAVAMGGPSRPPEPTARLGSVPPGERTAVLCSAHQAGLCWHRPADALAQAGPNWGSTCSIPRPPRPCGAWRQAPVARR